MSPASFWCSHQYGNLWIQISNDLHILKNLDAYFILQRRVFVDMARTKDDMNVEVGTYRVDQILGQEISPRTFGCRESFV